MSLKEGSLILFGYWSHLNFQLLPTHSLLQRIFAIYTIRPAFSSLAMTLSLSLGSSPILTPHSPLNSSSSFETQLKYQFCPEVSWICQVRTNHLFFSSSTMINYVKMASDFRTCSLPVANISYLPFQILSLANSVVWMALMAGLNKYPGSGLYLAFSIKSIKKRLLGMTEESEVKMLTPSSTLPSSSGLVTPLA